MLSFEYSSVTVNSLSDCPHPSEAGALISIEGQAGGDGETGIVLIKFKEC